jgi:hypothetical protein
MKPERMRHCKLSLNSYKELEVDRKLESNLLTDEHMNVRCSVLSSHIDESKDYFVFRTKALIFTINSKIRGTAVSWNVRRQEQDFYTLRGILVLSFGQCFIPPLLPTSKETNFDKKSLTNRQKSFTRFLRSVLKSKYLSSHPVLLEFLKIDHKKIDEKYGLKDFTKRLAFEETELTKKSGLFTKEILNNGIYKITAPQNSINLHEEFTANLFDKKLGKNFTKNILDEVQFLSTYEK